MRVITAAELDTMTPEQRQQAFEDAIIRDLSQVPPELQPMVDRARADVLAREARQRTAS